jgi:hypothetical protein
VSRGSVIVLQRITSSVPKAAVRRSSGRVEMRLLPVMHCPCFRTVRSQENAQRIWSSPLTEKAAW